MQQRGWCYRSTAWSGPEGEGVKRKWREGLNGPGTLHPEEWAVDRRICAEAGSEWTSPGL